MRFVCTICGILLVVEEIRILYVRNEYFRTGEAGVPTTRRKQNKWQFGQAAFLAVLCLHECRKRCCRMEVSKPLSPHHGPMPLLLRIILVVSSSGVNEYTQHRNSIICMYLTSAEDAISFRELLSTAFASLYFAPSNNVLRTSTFFRDTKHKFPTYMYRSFPASHLATVQESCVVSVSSLFSWMTFSVLVPRLFETVLLVE